MTPGPLALAGAVVDVIFTPSPGQRLRTVVERDDGVRLVVPKNAPDRRGVLPHDLAHFVVEAELGLADGFWGRIASGRMFKNSELLAGRGAAAKDRKLVERSRGGPNSVMEAEVLVRIFVAIWSGQAVREYGSIKAYLDAQPSPRTRSRAEEIDNRMIALVSARLDEMQDRWRRLAPGQELRLTWPVAVIRG